MAFTAACALWLAGEPPLSSQKVIPVTVDQIRKGVPEVIEQWRDTFGS